MLLDFAGSQPQKIIIFFISKKKQSKKKNNAFPGNSDCNNNGYSSTKFMALLAKIISAALASAS